MFVRFLLLLFVAVAAAGQGANIRWSPQAAQQVVDWSNGGGRPWIHTVERGAGLPGRGR